MLNVPVLFLIFNRPDLTKQVFETIRKAKPQFLYIAADGPREHIEGEAEKCKLARQIATQVDWNCEVKTLFREKNLGCKIAVSSAINWFFNNVEEGIILEDDTLPNLSFFQFCSLMLERYRNHSQVMHISGDNFQSGIKRGPGSYYFSAISHVWGWATWRRAWRCYDVNMSALESFKRNNIIKKIFSDQSVQNYWINTFEYIYTGAIDTWDIQWAFTCMLNRGLCVMPNVNLVSNIGFRDDATHTHSRQSPFANMPLIELENIIHPKHIRVDKEADLYTIKNHIGFEPGKKITLPKMIKGYVIIALSTIKNFIQLIIIMGKQNRIK